MSDRDEMKTWRDLRVEKSGGKHCGVRNTCVSQDRSVPRSEHSVQSRAFKHLNGGAIASGLW